MALPGGCGIYGIKDDLEEAGHGFPAEPAHFREAAARFGYAQSGYVELHAIGRFTMADELPRLREQHDQAPQPTPF